MASKEAGKSGQILSNVLRFLKIFTLNSWRRLLMLGHYTVICFHQQRLRCAWRSLGQRVHQALDSGEVNPMLAGDVKDSLAKAQNIKAAKDRHYQAIAALREKIRASRTAEVTPPPEEATAPAEEPEAPPTQEAEPAPVQEPEPAPVQETETTAAPEAEPEKPQE
jgi:hypothetical protein